MWLEAQHLLAAGDAPHPPQPPRELWELPESKLFVGRSKSLQLGDSLVRKPPHTLLEAELLSLRFLFRVGGEPDWKAAVNELQQETQADVVCDVFLSQLRKRRRSLKASMENSRTLMAAWGSSG